MTLRHTPIDSTGAFGPNTPLRYSAGDTLTFRDRGEQILLAGTAVKGYVMGYIPLSNRGLTRNHLEIFSHLR